MKCPICEKEFRTIDFRHYDVCREHMDKAKIEPYKKALEGLKTGDCFCSLGIGNPMIKEHTPQCKKAMELLNE